MYLENKTLKFFFTSWYSVHIRIKFDKWFKGLSIDEHDVKDYLYYIWMCRKESDLIG